MTLRRWSTAVETWPKRRWRDHLEATVREMAQGSVAGPLALSLLAMGRSFGMALAFSRGELPGTVWIPILVGILFVVTVEQTRSGEVGRWSQR